MQLTILDKNAKNKMPSEFLNRKQKILSRKDKLTVFKRKQQQNVSRSENTT